MNYANVKDLKLSDSEIYWILLYFYFGLEGHHRNGFFMIVSIQLVFVKIL